MLVLTINPMSFLFLNFSQNHLMALIVFFLSNSGSGAVNCPNSKKFFLDLILI